MGYEVVWAEGVDKDLENFDEKLFLRVVTKLHYIANSGKPFNLTEGIKGFSPNIRKLRIGNYRIFIYIKQIIETIYCLAVKHRKEAYKEKTLNQILTIKSNVKISP